MAAKAKPDSFVSLIMAGGSGTRFWPTSTKSLPKQYLNLFGTRSLIQETVDRLLPLQKPEDIFICSGKSQWALLHEQLPEIKNLILEPVARNTAPCLMLSIREFLKRGYSDDTVVCVFPADHHMKNGDAFRSILKKAIAFAKTTDALVTLGIAPTSPHSGYGYIEASEKAEDRVVPTKRFVEKPNTEKAREFLQSGSFYWNAGIFVWTLGSIKRAFESYLKDDWKNLLNTNSDTEIEKTFATLKSQPIDVAVLEKAKNVYLAGAVDIGWSDVGSWNAIYELRSKENENVTMNGNVESVESSGCLVSVPEGRQVALIGVSNLIVIESNGRLLIVSRDKDQLVRLVAEKHP